MADEAVQSGGAAAETEQATQADIPNASDGRNEALNAIVKSLEKGESDAKDDENDESTSTTAPKRDEEPQKASEDDEKPKDDEKAKPKDEPAQFDPAEHRKKIEAALEGLTEEQKAAVLGATSDEFAALHAREKRLKKREREFLDLKGKTDSELRELHEVRQEFDQQLLHGKQNPIAALELFGWTLEDAHAFALNDATIPHEKRLKMLEEQADTLVREKLTALDAQRAELAEQTRQIQEHTWREGVRGEVEQLAGDNVRWYIENFNDGTTPDERKKRVVAAVMSMQTGVFNHFKGTKKLDVQTALGKLERDVADSRRSWGSDPRREGAVQSANLEAGSKPEPRIPSGSSASQRHRPPNGGDEPLSREEVLRQIVADLERRA